jgi:ubiquinone/menaquinone biosynthesis C-methylase UbiE
MNPFDQAEGAAQYEQSRPYFHPVVMSRLVDLLGRSRLQRSLDVGCGTGQSSVALTAVSAGVVGLDSSEAMLHHRRRGTSVAFVRGHAERLPFESGSFDLVSAALAVHWFDQTRFLAETSRVLRPMGWLLLYDSGFCNRMRENPSFKVWVGQFRRRFPPPSRNAVEPSPAALTASGFREVASESLVHAQAFTFDGLMAYLMTQSNVLAAVSARRDSPANALAWLRESLGPMFGGEARTFEFDGWMKLYARSSLSVG